MNITTEDKPNAKLYIYDRQPNKGFFTVSGPKLTGRDLYNRGFDDTAHIKFAKRTGSAICFHLFNC